MDPNKFPSSNKRETNGPEKRKIEPAIDRVPDVRTPSKAKQFFGNFIASDMASVKEYVVMKVLLPRAQSMILDMIKNGAEMLIMGPGAVSKRGNSYTNYSRNNVTTYSRDSAPARPSTTYVPYADPLMETEDEAWDVIDVMRDYVSEYPYVSIADYLGFCNRPCDIEYTYHDYGWSAETIRNCRPEQIPDGRYVIKLPRPRYIR